MSRKICVLTQGFSEGCAADCENGHKHMSAREVIALEAAGEVEFFDLHPVRKTARYILRVHNTQRNHIPAAIIERAAGYYKIHASEKQWARRKIRQYGASNVGASKNLVAQSRRVKLPRLVWNNDGMEGNFASDGPAPEGHPVSVNLKPRTPDAVEVATQFFAFLTMRPVTIRALVKSRVREWRESLRKLDSLWPSIVDGFSAGPFSEQLNQLPPSELPSTIVHRVLEAFLQS